jgi:hypothetical protein
MYPPPLVEVLLELRLVPQLIVIMTWGTNLISKRTSTSGGQ